MAEEKLTEGVDSWPQQGKWTDFDDYVLTTTLDDVQVLSLITQLPANVNFVQWQTKPYLDVRYFMCLLNGMRQKRTTM